MKQYLLLCLACAAVYWVPVLVGEHRTGADFFLVNGTVSFIACALYLLISQRWASLGIACLELVALALNLVCLLQFLTVKGALYGAYGAIIDVIVALQCLVLFIGAPWDAVRRLVEHLRGRINFNYSTGLRYRVARQSAEAK